MKPLEAQHDPEQPVIEGIQQGDPYALDEFMRRHGRWVRGVIFATLGRMDEVDDVAQRAWMQVWREARRLEDPGRWRSWLYRIARNAAYDAHRERQRRGRLIGGIVGRWLGGGKGVRYILPERPEGCCAQNVPDPSSPAADQLVALDERRQAIYDAIGELPAMYREPFVLKHLEDWSYSQIAEALDLPVDTVQTRLVRARRRLREKLAGKV